jgi:hypothetical protein
MTGNGGRSVRIPPSAGENRPMRKTTRIKSGSAAIALLTAAAFLVDLAAPHAFSPVSSAHAAGNGKAKGNGNGNGNGNAGGNGNGNAGGNGNGNAGGNGNGNGNGNAGGNGNGNANGNGNGKGLGNANGITNGNGVGIGLGDGVGLGVGISNGDTIGVGLGISVGDDDGRRDLDPGKGKKGPPLSLMIFALAITPLGMVISTSSRVSRRVLRRPMAQTLPRSPLSRLM